MTLSTNEFPAGFTLTDAFAAILHDWKLKHENGATLDVGALAEELSDIAADFPADEREADSTHRLRVVAPSRPMSSIQKFRLFHAAPHLNDEAA